jgi:hypothetical protein
MATCATTSILRERFRALLALAVRLDPTSVEALARAYRSTGSDPKNNPEKSESSSVNPSELASIVISLKRGRLAGPTDVSSRNPP